jgi:transcriptional regulator with XRE-family HTH domain
VNEPIPLHVAPPPAPETGTGPGARLQAARVERGLEVAVAAQALHVAPRIIEAIESDRYEVFDAPVYARGFLRAYARLLNVPADEVPARADTDSAGERRSPAARLVGASQGSGARARARRRRHVLLVVDGARRTDGAGHVRGDGRTCHRAACVHRR